MPTVSASTSSNNWILELVLLCFSFQVWRLLPLSRVLFLFLLYLYKEVEVVMNFEEFFYDDCGAFDDFEVDMIKSADPSPSSHCACRGQVYQFC